MSNTEAEVNTKHQRKHGVLMQFMKISLPVKKDLLGILQVGSGLQIGSHTSIMQLIHCIFPSMRLYVRTATDKRPDSKAHWDCKKDKALKGIRIGHCS